MNKKKNTLLLKKLREFTKDSEMTEEDALRLGAKVNTAVAKRHKIRKILRGVGYDRNEENR